MSERVVVAGGGMSGLSAAEELEKKGFEVYLIDEDSKHVYTPSLPSMINGKDKEKICFNTKEIVENTGINFINETIKSFNPEEKKVETSGEDYNYDYLVVGLGGEMKDPDFSLSLTGDFYSIDSAENTTNALNGIDSATVVGAGHIGVEVALRLDSRGIETTIVDSSTRPLSEESQKASEKVLELLNNRNISFMAGREVKSAHDYGVEFEDGGDKESDLVIWCGGLEAPKIVQNDFKTDEEGIKVNKGLSAVEFENVYAVGKSANTPGSSRASEAVRQGKKAAENISVREGLLNDYKEAAGSRYICSPDLGILIRNDSVLSGRYVNLLGSWNEFKYRNGIKRRVRLRNLQISLDPILSIMD